MSEEEKINKLERTLIIVIACAIGWFFALWSISWEAGYQQGHKVAGAYHLATHGTMPSDRWVKDRSHWLDDTRWRILESLEKEGEKREREFDRSN